ncbi:MAG: hypothetical protein AAGD25_36720 [Cyanobacteria bacterium P01_F01_bin.150]
MKHNFIKSTSDATTQVGAMPPYISDPLSDPIRESMQEDLPEWMQSFLTWLTAKPYPGQTPFRCSPIELLRSAVWRSPLAICFAAGRSPNAVDGSCSFQQDGV